MTWKAVVVGCGDMGLGYDPAVPPKDWIPQSHALALNAHSAFSLTGIVEKDPERRREAQQRYPEVASFERFEDALMALQPDLVVVATPSPVRKKIITQAVNSNVRHVFCEKPLALTGEEADHISETCRAADVCLTVNYSRRWNVELQAVQRDLMSGRYGKPKLMTGYYCGPVVNNGAHLLDLVLWFGGDVKAAKFIPSKIEGAPHVWLDFGGELEVWLHPLSTKSPDLLECDIICEKGRVQLNDGATKVSVSSASYQNIGARRYNCLEPAQVFDTSASSNLMSAYNWLAKHGFQGWHQDTKLKDAVKISQLLSTEIRN